MTRHTKPSSPVEIGFSVKCRLVELDGLRRAQARRLAAVKNEKETKDLIKEKDQAVEKIDAAVVELKDAAQISDKAEEKEIEIEVEKVPEVKEVALDIPGKEISNNEIIVESTPDHTCSCAAKAKSDAKSDSASSDAKSDAKSDIKMDKSASSSEEFCRFAMLSKANKKKIADYWTMLGFPKDYVALMTKHYEK